jgi:hypothetical protein
MVEYVPLGAVNHTVPSGSHLCTFYHGPAGRDAVVAPFLAEGIRTGQKCLCVLETQSPGEVLADLSHRVGQADVRRSVETGQLEVSTPGDAYLRTGKFVTEDMLDF